MSLHFDEVFCINLDRRPDRWRQFVSTLPGDWPFGNITRVSAVDGQRCHAPEWWSVGNYAWACYKSHLNIIERCLNQQIESCLILEDDAFCCRQFSSRLRQFEKELPSDWQMVYLGGQHLDTNRNPPLRLSENIYVPHDINRCHAYAIRGADTLKWFYKHLNNTTDWQRGHHIDHHAGRAHQLRIRPIYCPSEWLIGQNEGKSDICWKDCAIRFFPAAKTYLPVGRPLPVVLNSGWNTTKNFNRQLAANGFVLVDQLASWNNPNNRSAVELISTLNQLVCKTAVRHSAWQGKLMGKLAAAIRCCFLAARQLRRQPALGHPALCFVAPLLENMLPGCLRIINLTTTNLAERPKHQNLEKAKSRFLATTNAPIVNVHPDRLNVSQILAGLRLTASS